MKGRRIYPDENGKLSFHPGDYGYDPQTREWMARPPKEDIHLGNLSNHTVTENSDGTITVTPSILIRQGDGKTWHGYLVGGVWTKV